MAAITLKKARAAKQAAVARLGDVAEVVGVGITRVGGEYAVKVSLCKALDPETKLPHEIDGVPVCIEIIGRIRRRRSTV